MLALSVALFVEILLDSRDWFDLSKLCNITDSTLTGRLYSFDVSRNLVSLMIRLVYIFATQNNVGMATFIATTLATANFVF